MVCRIHDFKLILHIIARDGKRVTQKSGIFSPVSGAKICKLNCMSNDVLWWDLNEKNIFKIQNDWPDMAVLVFQKKIQFLYNSVR